MRSGKLVLNCGLWLTLGVALGGCDPDERAERTAARASEERAESGTRRCGDFLSEREAQELGVEEYRPGKGEDNSLKGLVCTLHPVIVTIFMADQYDRLAGGATSIGSMQRSTGPELGKKTIWLEGDDTHQVVFLSPSGAFAFGVSGKDQDQVIQAGRLVSEGR